MEQRGRDRKAEARAVRERLRAGVLPPAAFREELLAVPWEDRDAWTHEVLGLEEPPPDVPGLPRGAVPYLPSSVDSILRAVDEAPLRPGDRLVDLGSGLGKVVFLAHLLTGAEAVGVELQAPLVERARRTAAELNLASAVRFVQGDAGQLCPEGTVFFIYSAFNGELLGRVLDRVRERARARGLLLCAVGFEVSLPWLSPRPPASGELTLYDVRAGP